VRPAARTVHRVTLEPRLRLLVALANRLDSQSTQTPENLRFVDEMQERYFGRLVIRPGAAVSRVIDRFVPVAGGRIAVRLYYPPGPSGDGPPPLHVFLHGGGWVTGTISGREPRCRDLAADVGCVVASVAYRLAPENTFPTAPEDCYTALRWLVDMAHELGVDSTRVSIGGESAGANLAAVVAVLARDRGGPALTFQLLDVPATDLTLSQPSVERNGHGYMLERPEMERYIDHYLPDRSYATDPMASPLFTGNLTGLPPGAITVAEYDPLHDDGVAYVERLRHSGVPVKLTELAGGVHPSFAFTRLLVSARAHHDLCVQRLRSAFSVAKTPPVSPSRSAEGEAAPAERAT
jgi:acetyl esterase